MIYLEQNSELYNSDIRTMLQAFFDNEKIVLHKEGTRISLSVVYKPDSSDLLAQRGAYVQYTLRDEEGYHNTKTVMIDYYNKKLARNPLKAGLYRLLSDYTGVELPWGTMTGVRPTKIATELLGEGSTTEQIQNIYQNVYLTTKQKADICIEVARTEQEILKSFESKEEYCLYVGIPFCPTRCLYCSFTSYPIAAYQKEKIDCGQYTFKKGEDCPMQTKAPKGGWKKGFTVVDYLSALFKELDYVANSEVSGNKRLVAIYIGGGTPSSLSAKQLESLISHIRDTFDMQYVREFCVECGRPDSITEEKLRVLRQLGVDRISINPQTMWDETLKLIGRAHTVEQTRQAFQMARDAGFENINMDIIIGLPGEDITHVRYTLEEIKKLAPDSLTVHSLAIKRAANLNLEMERYHSLIKGSTNEMMLAVDECARELGLLPYYLYRQKNTPGKLENVGYAGKDKACAYNILIMEEVQTIVACGAGTVTKRVYPDGLIERCDNVKDVDLYISRIDEMIERKRKLFY